MAKLIAFYSRAGENYFGGSFRNVEVGNTEKVAKIIGDVCGADLFKIEQKTPYSNEYKVCVQEAKSDFINKARPELVSLPESIDGYDEIFIGYPIYCGDMPMAVYTFIESFDWSGKTVYPFCTHEGSGFGMSEKNLAGACKGAEVKPGLAVMGSKAEQCKGDVEAWLND